MLTIHQPTHYEKFHVNIIANYNTYTIKAWVVNYQELVVPKIKLVISVVYYPKSIRKLNYDSLNLIIIGKLTLTS